MLLPAASTADLLDLAATRLVPDRADGKSLAFNLEVTDRDERLQINVHNNVLVHRENYSDATLPTIRTSLKGLLAMLLAGMSGEQAVDHQLMSADQDLSQLEQLAALLEQPKLEFNIIEP